MRLAIPLILLSTAVAGQAQLFQRLFNPSVRVTLTHPPGLGLKVQRVVFAPTRDEASEVLVAVCIEDLASTGQLEVLDRGNLARLLQEQKFSNSGLVDETSAVALGKVLGAPLMLLVKAHDFRVSRAPLTQRFTYRDREGVERQGTTYIAKTQVELSASIQAVDCATGRIYTSKRLVANPNLEHRSDQGMPEYPSDTEVRELALRKVREQVRRMLLAWRESRSLIFYDDKDYGMKEAYRRLQAQDYAGAEAKSQEALAQAKADSRARPKYLGRTSYNLGICKFIQGDLAGALPHLQAALAQDPDHGIFRESLNECKRALGLQEQMAKVEQRSVALAVSGAAPASPAASKAPEGATLEERLERLERLKDKGLLTPEEYQLRRAELSKFLPAPGRPRGSPRAGAGFHPPGWDGRPPRCPWRPPA